MVVVAVNISQNVTSSTTPCATDVTRRGVSISCKSLYPQISTVRKCHTD